GSDGSLAGESPDGFAATTVNVYAVPPASPVTVQEVVALVQVAPPGSAVTVYLVTPPIPGDAGGVQDTSTARSPDAPATPTGAPGGVFTMVCTGLVRVVPAPSPIRPLLPMPQHQTRLADCAQENREPATMPVSVTPVS